MSAAFFDTNILVYAFSDGDLRQERALALLADGGVVSVQCLNEFVHVVRRKHGMSWRQAATCSELIRQSCERVVPLDVGLHQVGLRVLETYRLSVYDGMIVAAALLSECDVLWSEDMHAGLRVDGQLTIVNPFA